MGILGGPQAYMRALKLPAQFTVFELGDQLLTNEVGHPPAEKFYREIGCGKYVSVDGNGRNGAFAWDLNKPLPREFVDKHGQFDLVTDFGTGEHIFDQAQVFRTLHQFCKPGGYIIFDRPIADYEGHAFYLIQPNLISAFAHANRYDVIKFERVRMSRGELIRGILHKIVEQAFEVPQQGRYHADLKPILSRRHQILGPDHKVHDLRVAGVVRRGKGKVVEIEDEEMP